MWAGYKVCDEEGRVNGTNKKIVHPHRAADLEKNEGDWGRGTLATHTQQNGCLSVRNRTFNGHEPIT